MGKLDVSRCFNRETGKELGFSYLFKSKSWVNPSKFFEWLNEFHSYIGHTRNRKVLLLVGNKSCQGTIEKLPGSIVLSPKTTSNLDSVTIAT